MASEEQISRRLNKNGISVGEYEFFPLHSTTIKQYKNSGVIEKKGYGNYEKRRADGLVVDRRNKKYPKVLIAIEWKKPKEFQTDKQKIHAGPANGWLFACPAIKSPGTRYRTLF